MKQQNSLFQFFVISFLFSRWIPQRERERESPCLVFPYVKFFVYIFPVLWRIIQWPVVSSSFFRRLAAACLCVAVCVCLSNEMRNRTGTLETTRAQSVSTARCQWPEHCVVVIFINFLGFSIFSLPLFFHVLVKREEGENRWICIHNVRKKKKEEKDSRPQVESTWSGESSFGGDETRGVRRRAQAAQQLPREIQKNMEIRRRWRRRRKM